MTIRIEDNIVYGCSWLNHKNVTLLLKKRVEPDANFFFYYCRVFMNGVEFKHYKDAREAEFNEQDYSSVESAEENKKKEIGAIANTQKQVFHSDNAMLNTFT